MKIKQFIDNADLSVVITATGLIFPLLMEEFLRAGMDFDYDQRKMVDVQHIFHMMEKRTLGAAYKFYCGKELAVLIVQKLMLLPPTKYLKRR